MKRIFAWTAAVIGVVVVGGFAYIWFSGGSGEPSTEITTPTIPTATDDPAAPGTSTPDATTGPTTVPTDAGGTVSFVIDNAQSTAIFLIDETLRGSPNRVEGTTNELAGQVAVDPSDLSTAQLSEIVVNGRTFATDSSFRDRAIRGPVILNSADDQFEFISFQPTEITGLSGAASVGDEVTFQVTGDLTVKGVTNSETFDVTVTFATESTIEGEATATVNRDDYGIGIPNAPGVADVSEEVEIRLVFVAVAG